MKKILTILSCLALVFVCGCSDQKETTTFNESSSYSSSLNETTSHLPYIDGKKLVVFGDSITAFGTWGEDTANELNMYFYNAAIGGITTKQGLERFDRFVGSQNPDFVTILFGHNDLIMTSKDNPRVSIKDFKENLKTFITKTRVLGAVPILLTNAPLNEDLFYQVQGQNPLNYTNVGDPLKWLDQYNGAIREVATEMECDLVDNRITFSEKYYKTYLSDGIHLNLKGNLKFKNNLISYFNERYSNDPTAKKVEKEDLYIKIDENNKKASLISFDASSWYTVDSSLLKFVGGDSSITLYNTNGMWPEAHFDVIEPVLIDVQNGYISYDIETKNVTTSIILFLNGATASTYSDGKYIVLNSYITSNVNGAGDILANQHLVGTIKLSDIGFTNEQVNSGNIVISGIKVFVAGNSNQNVIIKDLSVFIK